MWQGVALLHPYASSLAGPIRPGYHHSILKEDKKMGQTFLRECVSVDAVADVLCLEVRLASAVLARSETRLAAGGVRRERGERSR